MKPQRVGDGVDYYPTSCPEFDVWRVTAGAEVTSVDLPGIGSARVLLIISGSATLSAGDQTLELAQGEAALIDADEEPILTGTATGFLTAAGER